MAQLKTNYQVGDDYTASDHNNENTQINANTTLLEELGLYVDDDNNICQKEN